MENVAVLVDGAFFIKRALHIFGPLEPDALADQLHYFAMQHVKAHRSKDPANAYPREDNRLYRIFFYDCPPLQNKIYHPFLKMQIDMSKSERSIWRLSLHEALKRKRKVALRLGRIDDINVTWNISYRQIKKLCAGTISWDSLTEDDFFMDVKQKGVDMRIGIDITSLALKKQVSQIVLISGDSDFVPAAKFARREGIDFIQDPMWAPIKADLYEHIDGLRSTFPKPKYMQTFD
ncbi:NYN domain-containing protein [uncultured Dialister sp.]|uniref:NYN domain-containing protein n=1 Tax=uncultured Dialister sp. TaxID=278064 RepID=UPI002612C41D|nr:NYN domain-containing protein [uncultured Dialister sp.]